MQLGCVSRSASPEVYAGAQRASASAIRCRYDSDRLAHCIYSPLTLITGIVFLVTLVFTLIAAMVGWFATDVLQIVGWMCVYIGSMATIGSGVFAIVEFFQTPEKRAEALLHSGWGKSSTPPA